MLSESTWLTKASPSRMLEFLRGQVSPRKLRLLACANISTFCHRMSELGWQALREAESAADSPNHDNLIEKLRARSGAWVVAGCDAFLAARISTNIQHVSEEQMRPNFHEIFGNPFQPVELDPDWLTFQDGVVLGLATTIYNEKTFETMPILADALEDAGCAHSAMLEHLRSTQRHFRGCWVLDLLLSRS